MNEASCEGTSGILGGTRKKKLAVRKIPQLLNKGEGSKECKIILGKGATMDTLAERACPIGHSPKRASPMDIDPSTPMKKKRRNSVRKFDTKQKLITEVLKKTGGKVSKNGCTGGQNTL